MTVLSLIAPIILLALVLFKMIVSIDKNSKEIKEIKKELEDLKKEQKK